MDATNCPTTGPVRGSAKSPARRKLAHAALAGLCAATLLAGACSSNSSGSKDSGGSGQAAQDAGPGDVSGMFTRSNGTVAPEFQRTTKVGVTTKGGTTKLVGTLSSPAGQLASQDTALDAKDAVMLADKVRSVAAAGKALPDGTTCEQAGGSSMSVDMAVDGTKVHYDGITSAPGCERLYRAAENLGIALAGLVPDAFPGVDG